MIKDAYNRTCASDVLGVTPGHDGTRIEHKLLNGAIHVQTIGTAIKTATVVCLASLQEMEYLTESVHNGTPIEVDFNTRYYDGYVTGEPQSRLYRHGPESVRRFHITFEMYVSATG